jgi:PKD repeat protein
MTQSTFKWLAVLAAAAIISGCTMKDQDTPPLVGPSEFGQSLQVMVSPDVLPQDGASQSLITVTARDATAQPLRNMTVRAEIRVGGTPVDFGNLSARSIVTGNDGRAMVVYTAPPSPAVVSDPFTIVDIVMTPVSGECNPSRGQACDFNNTNSRGASIRLVPQGVVIPPGDLLPAFTFTPPQPADNQTVLFDASTSKGTIAEYRWSFGDGRGASGRLVSHEFTAPGTYVVTLTLVDPFGRTASAAQSLTVAVADLPFADFVFSPTNPRAGQNVNFNASSSRAPNGGRIVSYTWDFGDGTPRVTTPDTVVGKTFAAAATYTVTLVVSDQAGRTATRSLTIQIAP